MTTKEMEAVYLAHHLSQWGDKKYAVYNPHNKPIEELPTIWGFNNGGSPGWYNAVVLSDDGHCLGGHVCSSEGYMPYDLGIIEGARPDRHEQSYSKHYPDGYKMDFVRHDDPRVEAAHQKYLAREEANKPSDGNNPTHNEPEPACGEGAI